MKKIIDVCLAPSLYHLHENNHAIVVIIDIVRATTSICTAFENGVNQILPLATAEEAFLYREKGYLLAGECDSFKIEGFDLGNSPFEFLNNIQNKNIAFITSNGTRAIKMASNAKQVVIGSFLNSNCLSEWLTIQNSDILLFCSGVANQIALEDALFAGKIAQKLLNSNEYKIKNDSVNISRNLYNQAKDNLYGFVITQSRLKNKEWLFSDIKYCLSEKQFSVIPVLNNGYLQNM